MTGALQVSLSVVTSIVLSSNKVHGRKDSPFWYRLTQVHLGKMTALKRSEMNGCREGERDGPRILTQVSDGDVVAVGVDVSPVDVRDSLAVADHVTAHHGAVLGRQPTHHH